jgi:hypothetical protein
MTSLRPWQTSLLLINRSQSRLSNSLSTLPDVVPMHSLPQSSSGVALAVPLSVPQSPKILCHPPASAHSGPARPVGCPQPFDPARLSPAPLTPATLDSNLAGK